VYEQAAAIVDAQPEPRDEAEAWMADFEAQLMGGIDPESATQPDEVR
jgi:hypothetical protein